MKVKEFTAALGAVAIALRGNFEKPFVDLLWSHFGSMEAEAWKQTCLLVSQLPKSARFVVLRDFTDKALEVRSRREAKAKLERRREERLSGSKGQAVSMKTLCNLAIQYGPWWMKQDATQRLEKITHEEAKSRKTGVSS